MSLPSCAPGVGVGVGVRMAVCWVCADPLRTRTGVKLSTLRWFVEGMSLSGLPASCRELLLPWAWGLWPVCGVLAPQITLAV